MNERTMNAPIDRRQFVVGSLAVVAGCSTKPPEGDQKEAPSKSPTGPPVEPRVLQPRAKFNCEFPKGGKDEDKPGVRELFLSADGTQVALGNLAFTNKKIQFWDIAGEPKRLHTHTGRLVAFAPDAKRFVRWNLAGGLEVADASKGEAIRNLPTGDVYFRSPDLLVGLNPSHDWTRAAKLSVWLAEAGDDKKAETFEASDDDRVHFSAPAKDGREFFLCVEKANRIKVWDLTTRKIVREFPLATTPPNDTLWSGILVSPDGKWIVVDRSYNDTGIYDGESGTVVAKLPTGMGHSWAAFVPNRAMFVAASNHLRADKTGERQEIVAFDVGQKQFVAAFRGHNAGIGCLAVSADGKTMATGDASGEVLLWDLGKLS